jgi:hypothetical protein
VSFVLTRTLPDGTVKAHRPLSTLREVETAAAYVLMDNRSVPRGEARAFAGRLADAPLGTTVTHPSGYAFRVDRA